MTSQPRDVLVIHNEGAGDGAQTPELMRRVLVDAGYAPRYVSIDVDWRSALGGSPDLIVLIGGDGTISHAVRLLGGRDIPVGLLPTGTANNLAKTMGVAGDARDVVRSWREGFVLPLDVWEARTTAQLAEPFVEAVGGGLVATVIARDHELECPSFILGSKAERTLHLLREATRLEPERPWRIEVDGVDLSGRYLGVEVMNGPYVGPNIPLAPGAGPGDAGLEVVLFRPEHRTALGERFATIASSQSPAPATADIVSGRLVRLRPPDGVALHLDGDRWNPPERGDGWVAIAPAGTVNVLVGQRRGDKLVVPLTSVRRT